MAPKAEVKDEIIDVDAQPEPEVEYKGCRWGTAKKRPKARVSSRPKMPVVHNIISDSEDESSTPAEPGSSTPHPAPPPRPDVRQVVKARYNEVKSKDTKARIRDPQRLKFNARAGSSSGKGTTDDPMVISDDDDDTTRAIPPVAKRLKLDPSPDRQEMPMDIDLPWQPPSVPEPPLTDSEDEYPTIHAALDMRDNRNWKPLSAASETIDRVPDGPEPLSKHTPTRRRRRVHGYMVEPPVQLGFRPAPTENQRWLWDLCASSNLPKQRRPPRAIFSRNAARLKPFDWSDRTASLFDDLHYSLLTRSTSFRQAGGFISNISQAAGAIAISSATPGGHIEEDDSSSESHVDAQNQEGTLQFWANGSNHILHGHDMIPSYSNRRKFFTVNDVKFDPKESGLMASAGNDCVVRLWQTNNCDEPQQMKEMIFPDAPHGLCFNESKDLTDRRLAVTCCDGYIYLYQKPFSLSSSKQRLHVAQGTHRHSAGAMVWGSHTTSHLLIASSEPKYDGDYRGFHTVFDSTRAVQLVDLLSGQHGHAMEGGDAMAIDYEGKHLALFTCGAEDAHPLRLYDVTQKTSTPITTIELQPFHFSSSISHDGEVTEASFSPDGILLAVARNDNTLHVYDTRFLKRGPLSEFVHWGDERCVGMNRWGVTKATWVESWNRSGLGLVSGGMDGCIRLWDVRLSDQDLANGQILAQVDYDIGDFSIGDEHRGEKPLVIGDSGASVHIYEKLGSMGLLEA